MIQTIFIVEFLTITVYSYPPGWPLNETKIELQLAGISTESIDGLLEIASKFQFQRYSDDPIQDKKAAREDYNDFMMEVDWYIWTRSSEDLNHYLNDFISVQRANRVAERRLASRILCMANQTNTVGCVP